MSNRYTMEISVGVFVLITLLCVGYLTIQLGQMQFMGGNYYTITARFNNVSGLGEGNEVRVSGVQVGRVQDIELEDKLYRVNVNMGIKKEVKLSKDSSASIKTSGLIGDKYISITPGGSPDNLKPGDVIVDTQPPLDIKELLGKYVFGNVEGDGQDSNNR